MVAVPNLECDIYSRLWCVFVATTLSVPIYLANNLQVAGTCASKDARCSNAEDTLRIQSEIEDWAFYEHGVSQQEGFAMVDTVIRRTVRKASVVYIICMVGSYIAYLLMVVSNVGILAAAIKHDPLASSASFDGSLDTECYGQLIGVAVAGLTLYRAVFSKQGLPSVSSLCFKSCVLMCGISFLNGLLFFVMFVTYFFLTIVLIEKDDVKLQESFGFVTNFDFVLQLTHAKDVVQKAIFPMLWLVVFLWGVLLFRHCSTDRLIHWLHLRPLFVIGSAVVLISGASFAIRWTTTNAPSMYPVFVLSTLNPFPAGPSIWILIPFTWSMLKWGVRVGARSPGEKSCLRRILKCFCCCGCCCFLSCGRDAYSELDDSLLDADDEGPSSDES
eukprot:TRINITY_DN4093_c0_g2_i1.p1 TRINITY_DN4093_c0_g2~~TRINITY_DN4093_c0_g2_i1.p1  ORF type:complete len:454 (-),score=9.33 TRINITY_DN4093_c0_g2_i1:107-1267(-)